MKARPPDRYTCEEVFRRLDDYVDRELSPEETRLVEAHLETCAQCASEYAFEGGVLDGLRRKLRRIEAPADLRDRVTRALQKARSKPGGE